MKQLICILCLLLCCTAPDAAAESQAASRAALQNIAAHNKSGKGIESDFVQTRYVAFLDEELVSEGFFVFRNPDELIWQYNTPALFRLEYKGGKANFSNEAASRATPRPQTGREAQLAARIAEQIMLWISMDLPRIQAAYAIDTLREDPLSLRLVPKQRNAAVPVREMLLEFAPNNLDVKSLTLMEDDGDFIKLEFMNSRRIE